MTPLAPPDDRLIRLRTPRDVVATVPRLLGYRPRRSIVFLNVHDGNAVSTMRVDLPAPATAVVEKRFLTSLTGMLCKVPGIRKTLIVVYADGGFAAEGDVPRASFVRPLIARLVGSGFEVHDTLCVADDAWGAYDGPEAGVAHGLDELDDPAPGAEACAPVAASVDEFAALPAAGGLARRAFELALDRQLRRADAVAPVAAAEAALAVAAEAAGGTEGAGCAGGTEGADSDDLAAVMHGLLDPEARDVMLFTWAWGPERGHELVTEIARIDAGEVGPGDDTIALDLMGMGNAPPPDRARVAAAINVMSRVAALAPNDIAHVALTVLGWLHWSQGRGSVAGRFIDRARELDPGYSLAELLDMALARGLLANWVYVRPEP